MTSNLYEYLPDLERLNTGDYLHLKYEYSDENIFHFSFRSGDSIKFYEDQVAGKDYLMVDACYLMRVAVGTDAEYDIRYIGRIIPVFNTTFSNFVLTEEYLRYDQTRDDPKWILTPKYLDDPSRTVEVLR